MNRSVSLELSLAFACCRWPRSEAGRAIVRAVASEAIDWERFAGIIARNRISALAKDALDQAGIDPPALVTAQLAQGQSNAAFTSLKLARESIRLQQVFDTAGVPALIVKGAAIAMLAYSDLGRKESWDIDLLTDEVSVPAARRLLEGLGYALSEPAGLNAAQFARWMPHSKEAAFHHSGTGLTVELHWRLVDNELLLAGVGTASETQGVSLGGGSVRTLADAPLLAYLCVHGAAHNWGRLKWLADVGAFLGTRSTQEVERLYHAACGYGAERPVVVAVLLCQRMLGLEVSPTLKKKLITDKILAALVENVLASLEFRDGREEHLGYTQPWWRARLAFFFYGRGAAYLGRELKIVWASPFDHAKLGLPSKLNFLYHLLRVPLWLFRLVTKIRIKAI